MSNQPPQNAAPAATKGGRDPLRPPPSDQPEYDFEVPEGDDVDDDLEDVINVSSQPAKFNNGGDKPVVLKPGQATRISRAFTTEYKGQSQGDPLKPQIMRITGDRVVPAWHRSAQGHPKAHNRKPPPLEDVPFERAKRRR